MTRDDIKIINKSRRYDGYFQIDRYTVQHRLFDGGWTQPFEREIFERGHAIVVLLYDPDEDVLVFIEQFRMGAFAALSSPWWDPEASPWLIECVAGIIEDGEMPESVARREAVEEAGCEVTELEPIHRILASPGGCSESVHLFCGRTDASQAGGIHGLDDEHEDIRVLKVPVSEAFDWLDQGKLMHSATIIALQWFRNHHIQTRDKWLSNDNSIVRSLKPGNDTQE